MFVIYFLAAITTPVVEVNATTYSTITIQWSTINVDVRNWNVVVLSEEEEDIKVCQFFCSTNKVYMDYFSLEFTVSVITCYFYAPFLKKQVGHFFDDNLFGISLKFFGSQK